MYNLWVLMAIFGNAKSCSQKKSIFFYGKQYSVKDSSNHSYGIMAHMARARLSSSHFVLGIIGGLNDFLARMWG